MRKTNDIKWTAEKIESELKKQIELLGINHFPTHSELTKATNSRALAVAVSKHGGTRYWATVLNMPIKECESSLGNRFEIQAVNDIDDRCGLSSELTVPRYPYDIFVQELVKIDVKASLPIKDKRYRTWSFNLEKRQPTCDIFILYCLSDTEEIERTYIIPSATLNGMTQLGIANKSKYEGYLNRWDIINDYYDFYLNEKRKIQLLPKRRS